MKRKIAFAGTLFYCDGIQVFEGRDFAGAHYVGVALPVADDGRDMYALFSVSPRGLQRFRLGTLDLRTLITERADSTWWVGELAVVDGGLAVSAQPQEDEVSEPFLPGEGFVLESTEQADLQHVRSESRARNRLALEIAVETNIPSDEHRIGAVIYGNILLLIQSLVRHAYRKHIAIHGTTQSTDRENAPLLDVAVPAMDGSFGFLVVPARDDVNLFNASETARALEVVDYLLANVNDPDETLGRVREYAGHTASSFVRLLRFLVEAEVSLSYSWTAPDRPSVSSRRLGRGHTVSLLEALGTTEDLEREKRVITGRLVKVDVPRGTWRIVGVDGDFAGKTTDDVSLSGLITDALYQFNCEEQLEVIVGTGREIATLYLTDRPVKVIESAE